MTNKIDITSTAVEKSIDLVKSFVDTLISPSVEELGLLLKDQVSLWRFSNQIKILKQAKAICERNNINTKAISPKLLCPYLENASLEDDEVLQEKWSNLLVNMVDSTKNIQNHVFPYILSQLSKDEFLILEELLAEKNRIDNGLKNELKNLLSEKAAEQERLNSNIEEWKAEVDTKSRNRVSNSEYFVETSDLRTKIYSAEKQVREWNFRERSLTARIAAPQLIPAGMLKEFELANIIRLGLAKAEYNSSAGTHTIEVPGSEGYETRYRRVDFDIEIHTEVEVVITELGDLFLQACGEEIVADT